MSTLNGKTALAYARVWQHISAKGLPLGRTASQIAIVLMGKHKPMYHPASDCGDYVVVTDCDQIATTGRKMERSMYYSHSGKPGHLKSWTMKEMAEKRGKKELLLRAVSGMLPKNRLRDKRLERLKLFDGPENPYHENVFKNYLMMYEEKVADKGERGTNDEDRLG
ncbi:mitochondrial 54S ribosomal protein YmL23 [Schizosaccharomyces japonicus yFS275]|uniref:Ribosomal protein subunit L13 n=1 Tax=Schizosaccharomyces japonicus (strain yFS275 / FY16936) TaxID=402676 RepID=B6K3J1_SCHJY|nr:mitochondrial 54S ribosomal protein YmL23 [Schizosaccharomyces japonicus yFS275]EEB08048.1 ribosomal protein subunit L13 [Schizosaccharomyces japonicus yFS275]